MPSPFSLQFNHYNQMSLILINKKIIYLWYKENVIGIK